MTNILKKGKSIYNFMKTNTLVTQSSSIVRNSSQKTDREMGLLELHEYLSTKPTNKLISQVKSTNRLAVSVVDQKSKKRQ